MCLEEESQRTVQVVSPIHSDTYEAEIANLKQGSYLVYLEIHVSNIRPGDCDYAQTFEYEMFWKTLRCQQNVSTFCETFRNSSSLENIFYN